MSGLHAYYAYFDIEFEPVNHLLTNQRVQVEHFKICEIHNNEQFDAHFEPLHHLLLNYYKTMLKIYGEHLIHTKGLNWHFKICIFESLENERSWCDIHFMHLI